MHCQDLVENGGLGWHEVIGNLETTTQPVLRVEHTMCLTAFLLLDEAGFGRVAVERDGQESYLADDLVFGDLLSS